MMRSAALSLQWRHISLLHSIFIRLFRRVLSLHNLVMHLCFFFLFIQEET